MNKKFKFTSDKFSNYLLVFVFVLLLAGLVFLGPSFQQVAKALSSNYNKATGGSLNVTDWNNLPNDFVAKSGGTDAVMTGPLTLPGDPTQNLHAATKQYVDNAAGGGGGDTYINWGRGDCPTGVTTLYSGWAFSSTYDKEGGPTNVTCVQNNTADAGTVAPNYSSEIYPMKLASAVYIPQAMVSSQQRKVKCSGCYVPGGSCYTIYGTQNCATGFNTTRSYAGWSYGGFTLVGRMVDTDTYCINSNFDNTSPADAVFTNSSVWYGTEIQSTAGLPANNYTAGTFVKCAVCCN